MTALHRDGNTFFNYRRGWLDAQDGVQVVRHRKGWAVLLLADGYYSERATAERMADFFREEIRLAYESTPPDLEAVEGGAE